MTAKSTIAKYIVAAMAIAGVAKTVTHALTPSQEKTYHTDDENPQNSSPEMKAILEMRNRMNLGTVNTDKITDQTAVSLEAPITTINEWQSAIDKAANEKLADNPTAKVLFFEDISQRQALNTPQDDVSNGREEQRVKVNFSKLEKMVQQFGGSVDLRNDAVNYAQEAAKIRKNLVASIGPEG